MRRYTPATRPWHPFHQDRAAVTVNVALSDEADHGGGHLLGLFADGARRFERAEGQLIKPDSFCIDIGLFTVDLACEAYQRPFSVNIYHISPLRIGDGPFAQRSVMELAEQGSEHHMLRKMAGLGRRAPLSPEAFARLIATKKFTSGADAETVIELYRKTATDLLGSTKQLKYEKLAWAAEDYQHFGEAVLLSNKNT